MKVYPYKVIKSMILQWVFIRLFGAIPGPMVYGKISDMACFHWNTNCGVTGNCNYYLSKTLSNYMFVTCATERVSLLL